MNCDEKLIAFLICSFSSSFFFHVIFNPLIFSISFQLLQKMTDIDEMYRQKTGISE